MKSADANTIQSPARHRYELTTMQVDDFEHMSYTTYGIKVSDNDGNELLSYPDIATSKEKVGRFIDMLEKGDVALIHIGDILEDYLT